MKHTTWRSVAGTIEEVKEIAHNLGEENSLLARRLRDRILAAIPRFEASEDVSLAYKNLPQYLLTLSQKRKRRDYRLARKAQFTRPDPGFSLYEGRTRGKRMKYTYSDEEDGGSDALSTRRSNRPSGLSTPAESSGPTFTASGRQVRSRHGGAYGESMLASQIYAPGRSSLVAMDGAEDGNDEEQTMSHGRPRRAVQQTEVKARARPRKHIEGYNSLDSMDDESDATSSGGQWDGGDDEEADDQVDDEEEDEDLEMSDDEGNATDEEGTLQQSLVVSLRYLKSSSDPRAESTRQKVHSPQDATIPPAMSSVLDKREPSCAIQPAADTAEGNVAKIIHDEPMDLPDAMPNMP